MTFLLIVGFVTRADESVFCEVGDALQPGVYNVLTYAAPHAVKISELGLKEAGLQGARRFQNADEIRIFSDKTRTNESPKARIWINTHEGNRYWFCTGGSDSAEDYVIQAGEMVVVYTRVSKQAIPWKNIFTNAP